MYSKFDVINLCSLMDIIKGTDEYIESIGGFDLINPEAAESPDGPWVTTVHEDLKGLLFSIKDEDKDSIAHKWSQTEELARWEPKNLRSELDILIKCFKEADQKGTSILMVNAL